MQELKSIYCLVHSGVIEYIGQSVDPERRYKEHCRLSNNLTNTPRANWLKKLIKNKDLPELIIVARDVEDADELEKEWIALCRSVGQAKRNTSDGGQDTNFLRRAKANNPWGSNWSPLQRRYNNIRSSIREFKKRGWDTTRMESALSVVDTIVEALGREETNKRLWDRHHG